MSKLKGKSGIVTGGASGIGKATVEKFIKEGAEVMIWDINEERGNELVKSITAQGGKCKFYKVNTTDNESVVSAVKSCVTDFGKIDFLINNAGITQDATLLKMTDEQWNNVINVNLTGVFNCTRAVAPFMVEKRYGKIVNASSVVAINGNFGQTNYAATKAGVIAMSDTWAKELGRKGINVNAVAPGFILTEMVAAMPEKVLESMGAKVSLQRLGQPEDIANVYAFLVSDEANYINGATIQVDGGIAL